MIQGNPSIDPNFIDAAGTIGQGEAQILPNVYDLGKDVASLVPKPVKPVTINPTLPKTGGWSVDQPELGTHYNNLASFAAKNAAGPNKIDVTNAAQSPEGWRLYNQGTNEYLQNVQKSTQDEALYNAAIKQASDLKSQEKIENYDDYLKSLSDWKAQGLARKDIPMPKTKTPEFNEGKYIKEYVPQIKAGDVSETKSTHNKKTNRIENLTTTSYSLPNQLQHAHDYLLTPEVAAYNQKQFDALSPDQQDLYKGIADQANQKADEKIWAENPQYQGKALSDYNPIEAFVADKKLQPHFTTKSQWGSNSIPQQTGAGAGANKTTVVTPSQGGQFIYANIGGKPISTDQTTVYDVGKVGGNKSVQFTPTMVFDSQTGVKNNKPAFPIKGTINRLIGIPNKIGWDGQPEKGWDGKTKDWFAEISVPLNANDVKKEQQSVFAENAKLDNSDPNKEKWDSPSDVPEERLQSQNKLVVVPASDIKQTLTNSKIELQGWDQNAPSTKPTSATQKAGAPIKVTSREQYDKIPKGTPIIDAQGNVGVKP